MNPRVVLLCGHFVLALFFLTVSSSSGKAQETPVPDTPETNLSTPVGIGSSITYFDLVKLLCPDLQPDSSTNHTIPLRGFFRKTKRKAFNAPFKVGFEPRQIKSGTEELVFLDVTLTGEEINPEEIEKNEIRIAALFRTTPKPVLLDARRIQADRFTSITQWFDFQEKGANDGFLLENSHFNAGESYLHKELVLIRNGRFQTVTGVFLYETQGCGMSYTETASFDLVPDPGRRLPKVVTTVRLVKEPDGDHCEKQTGGYTRTFRGTYRWDQRKARYVGNDAQLDKLDKFNERRING